MNERPPNDDAPVSRRPGDKSESSHPVQNSSVSVADARSIAVYYFTQAKDVLTKPHAFFDQMSETGGFAEPLIFLSTSAVIYGLLEAIGRFNLMVLCTSFFSSIVFTLLGAAAINFALCKIGGKGNFESTFRVMSFSKATLLFAWISVGSIQIGGFLALFYMAFLNIVGTKKVHRLTMKHTAVVVVLWTLLQFAIKKMTHL